MSTSNDQPRLCFVGSLLGRNPGRVPSQSEVLVDLFQSDGFEVHCVSRWEGRLPRLMDTAASLIAWRRRIDLAIVDVFSGPAFGMADVASRILRSAGIPMIFVLRGGGLPDFAARRPRWVAQVLDRARVLVSPSGFLAHRLAAPGRDIRVIFNVLRAENYIFARRSTIQPRLLWMRSFHDIYHPELALHTLAAILDAYANATLTMAGQDSGTLDQTRRLAAQLGLESRVRFPGFLDRDAKRREFARHDVFLNTNRVDNMPVSVLEAAACGLPVVATRVGGIPFLLENESTALLVDDEDSAGMSRAVARLLAEPDLTGALSDAGRRLAESCFWPRIREQWTVLFEEMRHPAQVV